MIRLDHLSIVVADFERSRDWYRDTLGLEVEFEIPDRRVAAMRDDADLTLFVGESPDRAVAATCVLTFQLDDVERTYRDLTARGVAFEHAPQKLAWGYGAELRDPDDYLICLWDERTMREKG